MYWIRIPFVILIWDPDLNLTLYRQQFLVSFQTLGSGSKFDAIQTAMFSFISHLNFSTNQFGLLSYLRLIENRHNIRIEFEENIGAGKII